MMYNNYIPTVALMAENSDNKAHYRHMNFDKLSNRELLAILTSSDDDCEDSNLKQADLLLKYVNGDLNKLAWLSLQELLEIKGLRYATALTLACANTLLHKRTQNRSLKLHLKYDSETFYNIILQELGETSPESYWLFLFDSKGKFQRKAYLGNREDGLNEHRKIIEIGLQNPSYHLLLVKLNDEKHLRTSQATCRHLSALIKAMNKQNLSLLDYIIAYPNGYYSCKDMHWLDERE